MASFEEACLLLAAANRDFRALRGMTDSSVFADEIFGFHAQQAAEKALKAWLAVLDVEYPRTHDASTNRLYPALHRQGGLGDQIDECRSPVDVCQHGAHVYAGLQCPDPIAGTVQERAARPFR